MSREADDKIGTILERFGIPMAGSVWRVQGTPVIYHKTLEMIAAELGILFQAPTILRAERDECVMIVHGSMRQRGDDGKMTDQTLHEWSVGEAVVNVNYRVSGKQAAYVYAMAEKRAKDRVILKLIGLAGHVYSEAEADEFKAGAPAELQARARQGAADESPDDPVKIEADIRGRIEAGTTIQGVTDLMLEERTQEALAYLAPGIRDDLRAFAKRKLVSLGWAPREVKARPQGGGNGRQSARR